jgi:Protein of unknown function (DUF3617)
LPQNDKEQNMTTLGAIARISMAVAFLCCPLVRAADAIQPVNVRLGLWETTGTQETTGQMPIPAEAREAMAKMREELAKMPPAQRAQMEAIMNAGRGEEMMKALKSENRKQVVRRACVKKEDLDGLFKLGDIAESCTRTYLSSSSSKREMRLQCQQNGMKQTGSVRVEVVNPENVKGSMQMTVTAGTQTMTANSSFSSRWIGPACGSKE